MTACGNKNNAADDANAVEDTEAGTESGSSEEAVVRLIMKKFCRAV